MAYSDAKIKEFKAKDLRISKLAISKSLIEKLPLEDVYEVKKVTELAEEYINYVYAERSESAKRGCVGCVTDNTKLTDWEQIAEGLNLAIPNSQNIKILNLIADEYKKAHKASANPKDIIVHILNTFGTYPTKTESVKKVIQSLTQN